MAKRPVQQLEQTRANRPNRVSIHGPRDVLTAKGQEPGWHYCWVNDIINSNGQSNVEMYINGGYKFVIEDVIVDEAKVDNPSQIGSKVSKNVGNGMTAFLMRIPEEWHLEDMVEQEKRTRDSEDGLIPNKDDSSFYGKLSIRSRVSYSNDTE